MGWIITLNTFVNICFTFLLIALLGYWSSIAFPRFNIAKNIGQVSILITNIVISCILSYRWITNSYFPLSNLYESLIFLTWCLTFVQIIVEKQTGSRLIGAIGTPVELFIVAFASLSLPKDMQNAAPLVPALQSNWLMMHVTVMMLSYSFLIIGSLLSILFLIVTNGQSVSIKGSSMGYSRSYKDNQQIGNVRSTRNTIPQLPTVSDSIITRMTLVESIDNLSYRTIGLGFPLLTIGIISGAVWANKAWGSYWSWDPKETWALITWLIFASYLHSRLTQSWQGKKPAILASVGFVVVWVCYLGVNFLGKGLHSYGWVI